MYSKSATRFEPLEDRTFLSTAAPSPAAASVLPTFDHVVVVVEENKSYGDILGPGAGGVPRSLWSVVTPPTRTLAPYVQSLAAHGASFTRFSSLAHPSEPNYLALFSGSTQGVTSDAVPKNPLPGPSLGGELIAAGRSFAGYSESLPQSGFLGISAGQYSRSHNPWSDFADVPPSANLPFSSFPKDFTQLPDVSLVVPNRAHDMHSGSIRQGDEWLGSHLRGYAKWAVTHNSLLIVTFDEGRGSNHIPTIFYGAHVKRGQYGESLNHYNTLRTIQDIFGLAPLGNSAGTQPIRDIFA